jgi:hypothetical protein
MNVVIYLLISAVTGLAVYMFMDLNKCKKLKVTDWAQLLLASLLWPLVLGYVLWLKLLYSK